MLRLSTVSASLDCGNSIDAAAASYSATTVNCSWAGHLPDGMTEHAVIATKGSSIATMRRLDGVQSDDRRGMAEKGYASARELSPFDIACVVIGGIVGIGIFFTPGTVARRVDSAFEMMLAWGIGGVLAALGALVFADLAARVPGHGGVFRYLQAAFGRTPAFLFGWANWLVIQSGALTVVALLMVEHWERAFFGAPAFSPGTRVALAAASILVFTATNLLSLRVGKRVQNALIVVKVAAILALVASAATVVAVEAPAVAPESAGGTMLSRLAAAMLPVLFAVGGWQQGSFIAGAAKRPARDVPIGILSGVAVVIAVYIAINLAYLSLLSFDGARSTSAIGADAAQAALGDFGQSAFAAMVAVSAMGIMNTICMAPPYVLLAMAQEGMFPRAFGKTHGPTGTPVVGVLAQGLWASFLLVLVHVVTVMTAPDGADESKRTLSVLDFVCDSVVFVDWLVYGMCGLALLKLRHRADASPSRLPGAGVAAALFSIGAGLVALGAVAQKPWPSLLGALLVTLGLLARRWLLPHR